MNATTQAIIERLPKKPLLTPQEISDAFGRATSSSVVADIRLGRLEAVFFGGRYIVAREAAIRYVEATEYVPEEGELPGRQMTLWDEE